MDRLERVHFPEKLNGKIFMAQYDAWRALTNGKKAEAAE
jgi:SulP family sulfate permease